MGSNLLRVLVMYYSPEIISSDIFCRMKLHAPKCSMSYNDTFATMMDFAGVESNFNPSSIRFSYNLQKRFCFIFTYPLFRIYDNFVNQNLPE